MVMTEIEIMELAELIRKKEVCKRRIKDITEAEYLQFGKSTHNDSIETVCIGPKSTEVSLIDIKEYVIGLYNKRISAINAQLERMGIEP